MQKGFHRRLDKLIEATDYEQRIWEMERRLEEGLNQNDASVPKMQERIKELERELAQARSTLERRPPDQGNSGMSIGEGVSHHD